MIGVSAAASGCAWHPTNPLNLTESSFFSPACGKRKTDLQSIAYFADFIERNTCSLSSLSHSLAFCPDLVCPTDARVLGHPFAELPNGTSRVRGIRGFAPDRVTQWPPPGTVLGSGTTNSVIMTAVSALNQTLQCTWTVVVPPLVVIGEVRQRLDIGSYNSTANITLNEVLKQAGGGSYTGSVFKMRSTTAHGYEGKGASHHVKPRRTSGKTDGQVTIRENQTRASNFFEIPLSVELDLSRADIANISLQTEVFLNRQLNNNTVMLLGQIASYW
jgi:hypothetical protein